MLLPHLLTAAARRFPNKIALIFPGERISFSQLDEKSEQVARRLRGLRIGPSSRVAILSENSLASVIYFWGILKTGAESVDVPALAGRDMIQAALHECKPAAVVVSERQLVRLTKECRPLGFPGITFLPETPVSDAGISDLLVHTLTEICETEPIENSEPMVRETDVAMVVYTSGTTGRPKGVMLSHKNLISNIRSTNQYMQLTSDDSMLVVVPLYFIHGRMQLLTHMLIGGTVAFSAGIQFPAQVLRELIEHRVSGFSGVPYFFSALLHGSELRNVALPDLRYLVITGGALSAQGLADLRRALPEVDIHIAYGQTEASPRIANLAPQEVPVRPGSCGRPLPDVQVEILGEDGVEVLPGEVGEVVVSGPNVMCGYVSGDEVEEGVIDSLGRLHTGDLGKFDADGFLYLVGRISQMIKSAGERVFPKEIEQVIDDHVGVAESAVFGVPDRMFGERIVAWIVLSPGIEPSVESIRAHCLSRLSFSRTPREIRFVEHLPRTTSGKIDRQAVRAQYDQTSGAAGIERT